MIPCSCAEQDRHLLLNAKSNKFDLYLLIISPFTSTLTSTDPQYRPSDWVNAFDISSLILIVLLDLSRFVDCRR
jgi:hypothetical protein